MKHLRIMLAVLFFYFSANAQVSNDKTYFVVIGSFKMQENAIRFTNTAHNYGLMAQYAICPTLGLYYVYVLETNDHMKAHNLSEKIKEETSFKRAWIYTGKLGFDSNPMTPSDIRAARVNETERKLSGKASVQNKLFETNSNTKPFYFRVVSGYDGKEIIGNLLLQETEESSHYRLVKSGEVVHLSEPRAKQKSYNIIALLPGYRQNSVIFFYANEPIEIGPDNEEIITLTLEKAIADNFIEFNHVHFFKNTSMLRPVAQNELDELANLLKENPKFKIIIHGHYSNMQDHELNEFDQSGNSKASLNNLSLARAETVKAFLVQKGIDPSRLLTRGDEIYNGNNQTKDGIEVEVEKNSLNQSL